MTELNRPITFRQLLAMCPQIEVPLIQRDYAQGRETEKDVRDDFLKALHGALCASFGDTHLPLNLDFVYGSMEGGGRTGNFLPLDGQQRLTTLYLLHWYLAWRDGRLSEFESMLWDGKHSRFTYGVRPSSKEFFDELVRYVPCVTPDEVSSVRRLVQDQSWYFLHWRLDPTIQSVLAMLDAIHVLFKENTDLFGRLMDDERPAITFELLTLEHFGLTDDLYIKMNARGKPLTPFETFKARFEELLTGLFPTEKRELGNSDVSTAEFFERRIDTRWADFFWSHKSPQTHTFDDLVMNLLLVLARVSLDPASSEFSQDTTSLRGRQLAGNFSLFHDRGWLTREFASNLIELLETWSRGGGTLSPVLPNPRYLDEAAFFQKAIQEPAAIDYSQLVLFAALVMYLRQHAGNVQPASLNEWMRVVRNLASNSDIERPDEYGRSLAGLQKLLPHSAEILERLADTDVGQIGFSPQQVREEILKARLLLANSAWRDRIENAEDHGYFSGQIEFLLDFSGVHEQTEVLPEMWSGTVHAQLQANFDEYFSKAQVTFTPSGLAPTKLPGEFHLWRRALLSVGDYLSKNGSNSSFLTDPQRNWDSWKRFLRGAGSSGTRVHLKTLWDRIDANAEIDPQLEQIIASAADLEPWRGSIVKHPEVIRYCQEHEIRRAWNSRNIYLLKKRQMNGRHAELFTYVLNLQLVSTGTHLNLAPLVLQLYQSVTMTEFEPHVLFAFERSGRRVNFAVESAKEQFLVQVGVFALAELPEVEAVLRDEAKFAEDSGKLVRLVSRTQIHEVLQQVAQSLANLPS